ITRYYIDMKESKKQTARFIAAQVLNKFEPKRDYASSILDNFLDKTDQRQRATDLVFGSLRNLAAIDSVINAFSGCLVKRIQKKLLNIVRIGCYEIIYTPSTGEHSIVNEAAQNAKAIAGPKQVGFVNALLRQIIRHVTNRQTPLSQANLRQTLPQNIETGCEFESDFLPDDSKNLAEYLSIVFSLPNWLVTEWLNDFRSEKTRQICFASNRRPGFYIRPNTLKTTLQDLVTKFQEEGIEIEIIQEESLLRIKSPSMVSKLPGFNEGLFVVQDLTASLPVKLLNPKQNWKILDMCAAPGGKTTQLAETTNDSAQIFATDIDSERLTRLEENITRLGIKSVQVLKYEKISDMKFDCILLDVPCSNTGVLAKRIETRFRIEPKTIKGITTTQTEILEQASTMLNPCGTICYSTCSIQIQENSSVVKDFLKRHNDFTLVSEKLVLPSAERFDHDGGYSAVIVKKS
ncbi:MAG: methyltransferase domain-containing protein, partial [Sedimentisphaerales bacterium]|nr:methyltransferase domain-containing protein [Sedimentisphaerales bacterium]